MYQMVSLPEEEGQQAGQVEVSQTSCFFSAEGPERGLILLWVAVVVAICCLEVPES